MTSTQGPSTGRTRSTGGTLGRSLPAVAVVLLMGVAYTLLDLWQPSEPAFSLLAFVPGVVSAVALGRAGVPARRRYLRLARPSAAGLAVLAGTTLLLLPILGSSSGWVGWSTAAALLFAPASAVAQELYFRSGLLPGLECALAGRRGAALLLHALAFVGFHLRTFLALPSVPVAILMGAVLFLAGCGWGWQVQRDRTLAWAMVQHAAFLALMSLFAWG